jgi:tetratricopeptide (TPR) repeat protein
VDLLQAADDYLRALELTPFGHPRRADLIPKVVQTGRRSGRLTAAEAEAIAGEWETQAEQEGDRVALGRAKVHRSSVLGFLGEGDRSRALIAEAIEILEREPPGPELANAYAVRAEDEMLSGRPPGALDWSSRSFAHLPAEGHEELRVMTLQIRGIARCELGDDGGLEDLREALRVGRAYGLAQEIAQSLGYLGEAVWQLEGPAQGLTYVEESIEFATRRGLLAEAAWLKAESAWELFDLGRWDRLLERAEEIIAWGSGHGAEFPPSLVRPYRDRVLVHRGRREEVLLGLDELVERARDLEDIQVLAPTLATAAVAELDDGRAVAFVEELEEHTRDAIAYREAHLADVVERCLAAGRPDLAARQLDGVEGISVRHRNCVRTAHALLTEARGELEAATTSFVEAAHGWAAYGAPFERGRAELGWGRCLVALGRKQEATVPLRAARDGFQALLATPWIERADAIRAS